MNKSIFFTRSKRLEADFYFSLSEHLTLLSVNESVSDLLGYGTNSFLNERLELKNLIHKDDQDISEIIFSAENAPKFNEGFIKSFNLRMRRKNGSIICLKAICKKEFISPEAGPTLHLLLQDGKSLWKKQGHGDFTTEFTSMMENTNDYIYFKDRNHVFTGASQTLVSLTDPSEHWTDLLGKTDYDVFPEEYADGYYSLEKQVFAGIPVAHRIQETLDNDGKKGWVDNRKYPIFDENKQIIGLFGIARIITESKKAQESLKLSQNELLEANKKNEQILNATGEGIYGLDLNGHATFANPAAEKMLGYSLDEMKERSQHELIHHTKADGSSNPSETCKIYNTFKTGKIGHAGDELFWRKDGSSFPVEYIANPIIENDEIKGAVVSFNDISKRLEAEESLTLSENRFRKLFEESPFGVALIDSITGQIYEVNPMYASIVGMELTEMIKIDWMKITHPDDIQEDLDNMEALNTGKIKNFTMEKRYIKPDGSHVWVNLTVTPITSKDIKKPVHLAMVEDITEHKKYEEKIRSYQIHLEEEIHERTLELKKSQEQLIHSEKLSTLGRFAGSVAHEFNNPLFGLISLVEQLGDELTDKKRKKFSKLAEKECWRMAGMIKNLQSFYQPSEENFTPVSINTLIEETLLIAGKALKEKGIEVKKDYTKNTYTVDAIEDQIKQVILNVIQNAIDSIKTNNNGKITLTLTQSIDDFVLKINDTGTGIEKENMKMIFDPFFSTKGREGTGLGLSVSYGIIKKHGGDITIDSQLGIGSTVTLVIPIKRKI